MKAAITGGAGFLGTELARRLIADGAITVDGSREPLDALVLADLVAPRPELLDDPRVSAAVGDLPATIDALGDADVIFHLAGVVSGAAEADFDLGMATNLDAFRTVLEACRRRADTPVLVFSSSLAVFGAEPGSGPIGSVDDDTLPRPQSSYGIQKFIGEQLVADYTRKGFVHGRSVRLMTVSVRPGRPNAAASSFLSGMVREPLAGQRAACPVPPDTPVALSSPRRTVEGLLRAASATAAEWGGRTAVTLPALTTTPRRMAEALERVAGADVAALIDWTDDAAVREIVAGWPARFVTRRADALGLRAEESFDDIVREYVTDHPEAVTAVA